VVENTLFNAVLYTMAMCYDNDKVK
jgi:hypothetical protein